MKYWNIHVDGVGDIGTIHESSEETARCGALWKFGEGGNRKDEDPDAKVIYEDDTFSVSPT